MSHKQIIVLRKDLNMRKGKMVAQGSHASLGAILSCTLHKEEDGAQYRVLKLDDRVEPWINGCFKKICVSVNSEEELIALEHAAKNAGMITCLIEDSGLTEFNGVKTKTALAIGPDLEEKIDVLCKHLPLL